MRVISLRKDTALSALASGCGVSEKELMRINGLERSALLPCGMSIILPSKLKKSEQKTELFVSYTGSYGGIVPSAHVQSASIFAPGEHRAEGGTLPLLSVSNTDEKGFVSPEQAHRLFADGEAGDDTAAMLTAKLENEGWGGLVLDMEYLFPFDRAPYTAFVEKLEKAVHGAGRWLILALPAEAALRPHSRGGAAYDFAALSGLCERVIFTCDAVWTEEILERCISALSGLMPAEKVILGLRDYGFVRHGGHETAIKSCAAHNLAVSARARIYREGEGFPAGFDFTDAAGGLCHVEYTDALWFCTLAKKIKSLGLAGLFLPAAAGLCPGGEYLSDWLFEAEKLV